MVWHKVTDALSAKLAFFPPSPPSYQLALHGDGEQETYIQPLRRWACSEQPTCMAPALRPVAGCSAAAFLDALVQHCFWAWAALPFNVSSLHQAPPPGPPPPAATSKRFRERKPSSWAPTS
jgi:hypothetical protein